MLGTPRFLNGTETEVLRGDAVKRSGQARRQNLSVEVPFINLPCVPFTSPPLYDTP